MTSENKWKVGEKIHKRGASKSSIKVGGGFVHRGFILWVGFVRIGVNKKVRRNCQYVFLKSGIRL